MKPSQKAIESVAVIWQEDEFTGHRYGIRNAIISVLEAFIRIDIDPLLAELSQKERLALLLFKKEHEVSEQFDQLWHESERLNHELKQRISTLETENVRLKGGISWIAECVIRELHGTDDLQGWIQMGLKNADEIKQRIVKLEAENAKLCELLERSRGYLPWDAIMEDGKRFHGEVKAILGTIGNGPVLT